MIEFIRAPTVCAGAFVVSGPSFGWTHTSITNYEEACMAKADKATAVADIAEQFKEATATSSPSTAD